MAVNMAAQSNDSIRTYTSEHPLVYEDVWDLWPYSFLNDDGEPDGFNIDLIKMMMKELDIPYTIKLKPSREAYHDLKDGRSDLMLGLEVGFHDEFGKYSENAVTLFTQSVVTPKHKSVEIESFRDLAHHKVIVNDSSLCHHLMIEFGWGENAQPVEDMCEAIQRVSLEEDGQIVWNTLSLKWLMQHYNIENLKMTPVNMQHGQYKFMSNDTLLLKMLDQTYTRLYSAEKITSIQNKWFYPEKQNKQIKPWVWYLSGTATMLLLIVCIYGISYRVQARRLMEDNKKRNKRLALILETSNVRIWTYDVKTRQFAWRNEKGQVAYTYTMDEFSHRYSPEDFILLRNALERLSNIEEQDEEEEITLNLKAKDTEDGDKEYRDYYIVLSVFSRDKDGKPAQIIGTKKDVTEEHLQQRLSDERTLRYWSIFYNPMVGIMLFDKHGILTNINPKACEIFDCDAKEIIHEHITMADMLDTGTLRMEEANRYFATQLADLDHIPAYKRRVKSIRRTGKLYNEFRLMAVYDDSNDLLCVLAICRDVTTLATSVDQYQLNHERVETIRHELDKYTTNINLLLHNSLIRPVTYSPTSHTLTISDRTDHTLYALTQTRCMTLVDGRSSKAAMHILNDMDEGAMKSIDVHVRTTLRVRGGMPLELCFVMRPVTDKHGRITSYKGVCMDVSEERHIAYLLAQENAKVQEVENAKNSFTKNMVSEIRIPMNIISQYVAQINEQANDVQLAEVYAGILNNADYLLHLIDNILYLSRLEAHMVEICRQQCNFAEFFQEQCEKGWSKYRNSYTRYVVENPYEQLLIDVDAENIGHAIEQIAANAAQHTFSGVVKARYEYIGRRLVISMDDTGEGIPKAEMERLVGEDRIHPSSTKGLGLAICMELVQQMGGNVEISSEEDSGTTIYIMIPCHASVIKRKKQI